MPPPNASRRHETGLPQRPRFRRRRWMTLAIVIALLLPGGIAIGLRVFTAQFPKQAIASCTIGDPGHQTTRRSATKARLFTDCGRFRATKHVECTSDPTREIALIQGATYNFEVQGPRVPLLSAPKVVSATVAAEQPYAPPLGDTAVDPDAHESLQELQRQRLPETLRAFDYEQPPYDPSCDPYRRVMTTNGLQIMSPERATQLLTPPEGITPREPKLPCEGHPCPASP